MGRDCHQEKLTSSRRVGDRVVGEALGPGVGDCVGPVGRGVVGLPVGRAVTIGEDVGLGVGSAVKSCTLHRFIVKHV